MRLHEIIERQAAARPSAPALIDGARTFTFAELHDRVRRARAVIDSMVEPGACVAVIGANHHGWIDCYYGIPAAGRVLVLLNHRLSAGELEVLLERSGAEAVIGADAQLERLDLGGRSMLDWTAWEAALAEVTVDGVESGESTSGDDLAWLLFTSGTTAAPKGAMLTHASLLAAVDASTAARPVEADDIYLVPFPLCHVAGYNVLHRHRNGRPVVLVDRFDPASFCRCVAVHGVTSTSLAATMLDALLDLLDAEPARVDDLVTLRSIAYGAAPMSVSLLRRADAMLHVDLAQGYGMTELSGNAVFLDAVDHRRGIAGEEQLLRAAGRPAPGVEVRLADDGEILVRAPQAMIGYWNDPDATARALVDGWLATGDIGRFDDTGLLYVVDRSKDIVITGGENVSSREVEEVLVTAPGIARAAVVAAPDARWGESVCAFVVPSIAGEFDEAAVVTHARARLAGFKVPKRFVLIDALPVNASGKVLKNELRALVAGTSKP